MKAWRSGRVVDILKMLVRAQLVLFSFLRHGMLNVKLRTLEYFTLYLRNRQSGNLRTIENCICGLRSIERNMRSFLRTVYFVL
jgi:hypothetical protein